MHKRRLRLTSAKSTIHPFVEKQHVLPDLIAKANREYRRETKGARWSRRTCKRQTQKKAQAISFQLASHFSSNVSSVLVLLDQPVPRGAHSRLLPNSLTPSGLPLR